MTQIFNQWYTKIYFWYVYKWYFYFKWKFFKFKYQHIDFIIICIIKLEKIIINIFLHNRKIQSKLKDIIRLWVICVD